MRRVLGEKKVIPRRPQMIAEDFSYFQKVIPGFFYFLGVGNSAKGINAPLHTPNYDVDEESLVVGVRVMSNVVLDYLDRESGRQKTVGSGHKQLVEKAYAITANCLLPTNENHEFNNTNTSLAQRHDDCRRADAY